MKYSQERLEYTIMDLGAEIFKLKEAVSTLAAQNEELLRQIKTLKSALHEKNVLDKTDLEEALDFARINEQEENFALQHRSLEVIDFPEMSSEERKKKAH